MYLGSLISAWIWSWVEADCVGREEYLFYSELHLNFTWRSYIKKFSPIPHTGISKRLLATFQLMILHQLYQMELRTASPKLKTSCLWSWGAPLIFGAWLSAWLLFILLLISAVLQRMCIMQNSFMLLQSSVRTGHPIEVNYVCDLLFSKHAWNIISMCSIYFLKWDLIMLFKLGLNSWEFKPSPCPDLPGTRTNYKYMTLFLVIKLLIRYFALKTLLILSLWGLVRICT